MAYLYHAVDQTNECMSVLTGRKLYPSVGKIGFDEGCKLVQVNV